MKTRLSFSLGLVLTMLAADNACGWPPVLDVGNTYTKSVDGRTIEQYVHQSRDQWGYKAPQQNHFFLVHPKKRNQTAPLCVVLHSANRTGFDYLGYFFLNRKVDPNDNPSDVGEHVPADFYALFLDSSNDEWWGWASARDNPAKHAKEPTPAEARVLDTVDWVAMKYNVDRNRIYLTGVSMGGCGSLGIGLPHGDVFAAMRVWVPAGTGYAACRMDFPPPPATDAPQAAKDAWLRRVSCAGSADPPVVVDLSAQNDTWSNDQAVLLNAASQGRLPLVVGWGPFGHTGGYSPVAKYPPCAAVLALPWMEIRKNQAYPVFIRASSDQRAPWLNKPGEFDDSGQINAYFRWKVVNDTPNEFAMRLWLAHPAAGAPSPKESTADVTLRRLQQFRVAQGRSFLWQLVRKDKPVASGVIQPDAAGLLTVPRATIATAPTILYLKPQ
jgi:poly(3-hydroxybutyrate) depolymerase